MKIELKIIIIMFFSSLLTGIYLSRQNYLNDIIWLLPIVTSSSIYARMLCEERTNQSKTKEK